MSLRNSRAETKDNAQKGHAPWHLIQAQPRPSSLEIQSAQNIQFRVSVSLYVVLERASESGMFRRSVKDLVPVRSEGSVKQNGIGLSSEVEVDWRGQGSQRVIGTFNRKDSGCQRAQSADRVLVRDRRWKMLDLGTTSRRSLCTRPTRRDRYRSRWLVAQRVCGGFHVWVRATGRGCRPGGFRGCDVLSPFSADGSELSAHPHSRTERNSGERIPSLSLFTKHVVFRSLPLIPFIQLFSRCII
jgi:hypothetical protein